MEKKIPSEMIFDLYTRIDDLLAMHLEATEKLTESIDKLTAAIAPPEVAITVPPAIPTIPPAIPAVPPAPPKIVLAPAPAELLPLTTRLDLLGLKMDAINENITALNILMEEYKKHDIKGRPVAVVNTYSGSDTSYKTVVEWRVGDMWGLRKAAIEEISMATNDYDKTHFRLSVMGKVLFKDQKLERPLTLLFQPHEIPQGEYITLGCKSTDGTNIKVDGSITGKES